MMEEIDQLEEACIVDQNFQRITQGVVQNGFADGVADGREALYQKDFNRGYQDGFAMAFELGRYKGLASGLQEQQSSLEPAVAQKLQQLNSDLILRQEIARAHCQLCLDKEKAEREQLDVIIADQQSHNQVIVTKLCERYGVSRGTDEKCSESACLSASEATNVE